MGGIGVCGISIRAGPSFSEELGANNSVSRLVLSNNSSYNLHSFAWELVYLGKSSLSKMVYMEWKMIFPCVWHIKQYSLFSYPINIINPEYSTSLLVWTWVGKNT